MAVVIFLLSKATRSPVRLMVWWGNALIVLFDDGKINPDLDESMGRL
jgi:hypothetical protein